MKVGIISDSHNSRKAAAKAVDVFNERNVSYVFHAGDITSPATAQVFSELKDAKFTAVFGNCDSMRGLLRSSIDSFGGEIYEDSYSGNINGRKIYMVHRPTRLAQVVETGQFDLVIYGHTHKRDIHKVGNTLVINPGRSAGRLMGESSVVVLELDGMNPEVIELK